MRDRQSVIGFTEAELGLVLALVGLGLWASVEQKKEPPKPPQQGVVAVPQGTIDSLVEAAKERDYLRGALQRANAQLANVSTQTPRCIERGYAYPQIASITVLEANTFAVGESQVDLEGLLELLKVEQRFASDSSCRHAVWVTSARGLGADEFTRGLKTLRSVFNTAFK